MMVLTEMIPGHDLHHFFRYGIGYFLSMNILFKLRLESLFFSIGK